jgi:hypothetical protein
MVNDKAYYDIYFLCMFYIYIMYIYRMSNEKKIFYFCFVLKNYTIFHLVLILKFTYAETCILILKMCF